MRTVGLLAVVLIAVAFHVPAQVFAADTADCTGLIVDENGVPVPAAQIKLELAGGQGYRAETNSSGRFILRRIPAGEYKAEVRKQGFFLLSGRAVTLHTGSNDVTFTLNHAEELHTQVQVTAEPNQIDPQDTTQRNVLTAEDIRDIPVPDSHVLTEYLRTLPEIVQDNTGGLHVSGARPGDTQYLLDGFEIGDPVNNSLSTRFNVDATRAAEVQSGSFGAEYAHAGASILNLQTPDGDDKWRFGTSNPAPGINLQQGLHLGDWYPRFTFSGPIERGRFWFSDAISVQHIFAIIRQLPGGQNSWTQWAGDNLLRLQYNITPRHILHASFLYNRSNVDRLGLDALNPVSTTLTLDQSRAFTSLKDQIWVHDTLFEVGLAGDSGVLDFTPQGTAPYILQIRGSAGNFFERLHQRGKRLQGMSNVILGARHWHGTHQFAVGGNVAGLVFRQSTERTQIDALRADGTLVRQSTFGGPATPEVSNTQVGGYAQDTWTLSKRFLLNAGFRTDWDRFTQSAMAEPRVAANFLPFADDRAKASVGWEISNAALNLSLIAQAFDQQQLDTFYDPTGTIVVAGPAVSEFDLPAGGLQQPRFAISNASWQQKVGRTTLLELKLLARNGYHGFAYVDQQPTQAGGIFLLEDHRKDRYRAATVSARHAFSDTTEIYFAYTRSRATSNEVLNPALGSIFYAAQVAAPVAWDAPNRIVAWGWTPTHIWGLLFSGFFEYRSGYPYSAVNLEQQLVGPPNSFRFPAYINVNLGLEKKFAFRGYLWAVRGMVVNPTDRLNPDTVVNNVDAPNFGTFLGGQGRAFTARVRFAGRK
jgi:Carboxypeptidase regulatory-like domain/TonB dependent receptor